MSPKLTLATQLGRLLHAGMGVVILLSLVSYFGHLSWFCHVFEHFRLQYMGVSVLAAAYYLWQKKGAWAGMAWAVCFTNALSVFPHVGAGASKPARPVANTLKVMSINVLMDNDNKQGVVNYILQENPGIVAVIEVDSLWEESLEQLKVKYPFRVLEPLGGNFGMALYSQFPIRNVEVKQLKRIPLLMGEIQYLGRRIFVMAVHAFPPVEPYLSRNNLAQLRGYADIIREHQSEPILVMGDFNQTPWSTRMQRFRQMTQLTDSAISFAYRPSWPTHALWLAGIRVDHILHSDHFSSLSFRLGPKLGSDHLPVVAEFAL